MNPKQTLWEKGDFTRIAASMRDSGEALAKELAITRDLEVLDLGCGDRTTALPAAALGANVLGVDIASNLVEAGNARARSLGLTNCRSGQGDTHRSARSRERSLRPRGQHLRGHVRAKATQRGQGGRPGHTPGGRIVMGNWIPNDPTLVAQVLKISSSYSPPPPEGFISPMTWAVEEHVIEGSPARVSPQGRSRWSGTRTPSISRAISRARRPSSSPSSRHSTGLRPRRPPRGTARKEVETSDGLRAVIEFQTGCTEVLTLSSTTG